MSWLAERSCSLLELIDKEEKYIQILNIFQ